MSPQKKGHLLQEEILDSSLKESNLEDSGEYNRVAIPHERTGI